MDVPKEVELAQWSRFLFEGAIASATFVSKMYSWSIFLGLLPYRVQATVGQALRRICSNALKY